MPLRALLAALVLGVFGAKVYAADLVGYGEAFNALYSINLTTQSATEIGKAGYLGSTLIGNIEGLTFSPNGTLYAVSDASSSKTLLTIDRGTGLATAVGVLNLGTTQQLDLGLAFTCDGKLWMSSGPGMFWQVDPATAAVTLIGNLGVKVTGLAARGSALYGAGSQGNNTLYRIDPSTAQATAIGVYGSDAGYVTIASPGFDSSGKLWAVLDYVPPPSGNKVAQWSDLAQIDVASGTLTNLGPVTAQDAAVSDLEYIGIKGLAIAAPTCTDSHGPSVNVASTPALSWGGLAALIALLMLLAGTRLRPRRLSI